LFALHLYLHEADALLELDRDRAPFRLARGGPVAGLQHREALPVNNDAGLVSDDPGVVSGRSDH